jgi:hypothetical protein
MSIQQNAKTILIGFADALAAPEVFFSLHHRGYRVYAFQRSGTQAPLTQLLPVGASYFVCAPEKSAESATADLVKILRENDDIDVLLALDDTSLWLANEALGALGEGDRKPLIANATGEQKDIALDKVRQIEAAKSAGFSVPSTIVAHSREEISKANKFPAIVKPARAVNLAFNGALKKGEAYYLYNRGDLETLPEEEEFSFPVLIQPLIHGTGEGIFGFAGSDGVSKVFGHRRLRMMNPHGSGASACRSIKPAPDLVEKVQRLITSIGWRGPFMVELLMDEDGNGWFIELNGRLWGSTALSRRHGYDYPGWAVDQALEPSFRPADVLEVPGDQSVRHLGREIIHLMFVAKGPKSKFHAERWPNLLQSLLGVAALHSPSRFYNYDRAFPLFFLREAVFTVMSRIRKRKK